MKVYSGDPDLYINPKEVNLTLNKFKYNSLETLESEELVLTPQMREDDQNIVGEYYICVYGRYTSSFKLVVRNDDVSSHMLESGVSESGYLAKNEIINYWYREDILKTATNISFQLHAMSGTEIIEHDPTDCTSTSILNYIREAPPTCLYNVGVVGNADNIKSHYGVTIRHQEGHHVLLNEGQMVEGSIVQKQYNYYKISIHDPLVSSITIQLLAIHGDPDLFMSRSDEYPSDTKNEKKATICGRYPDTITYNVKNTQDTNGQDSLVGNYFIGVYGFVESTYHLYYEVERIHEDETGTNQTVKLPVKLSQSKALKGFFRNSTDYSKYKFTINNVTSEEEIIIKIIPQNGKFRFYVKFGSEASPSNYDKIGDITTQYAVEFDPSKNSSYSRGEYFIYVEPILASDMESSGMSYTFLISYYIGSHHITLLNDQPTYGHTKSDHVNYYSYAFTKDANEIKIGLTKMSGDIEVIISLNQNVTMPIKDDVNSTNGVFLTSSELNIFTKEKITQYCQATQGSYCVVSIAVEGMAEDVESTYVLTSTYFKENEVTLNKIESSIPLQGSLKANEWTYYWYTTSNAEPVYAVSVPTQGDPNMYVAIIKDLSLKKSDWVLPTDQKYLKKSEDSVAADILVLSQTDLESCNLSCVLVFGIKANQVDASYTLTVSRGIAMLKEKEAFTDSIGTFGDYKFYEYYRPCQLCTTVFSINSLSNDQYTVLVNFNTTDKISTHSENQTADFTLQGRGSQELRITSQQLLDKGYYDSPGYFLVEVHSHSNLNYTISGSSNLGDISSLDKTMWIPFSLNDENLSKTFAYKHNSNNSFYVSSAYTYGYGEIYVNVVPQTEKGDISKYIPDRTNHTWPENYYYDYSNLEIKNDSKKFCNSCYYLITVVSWSTATGEIAIQEKGSSRNKNLITNLKMGMPVKLDLGDVYFAQYKFIVPNNEPLLIDVNVLHGTMEYKLTNALINETEYDNLWDYDDDKRYIHYGWQNEGVFVFDNSSKYFEVGKTFYLSVKSYQALSRAIISVGHKGEYHHISDATPLRVIMDNTEHLYYYTINSMPGKSKIVIETFPQNKFETYKLYAKLVSAKDVFKDDVDASTAPDWHLDYNQIASEPDYTIEYNGERTDVLFTSFEININTTDYDKVLLIAVKPTNAETTGSLMDLYVASSSLQTLELDIEHWGNLPMKDDVFQLYEVFVPHTENETYVVEVRPCYGSVSMYVSKDFKKLLNNEYEFKGTKLNNGKIYGLLENESNTTQKYIISIKNTNKITSNESGDWSQFKILFRKYPRGEARQIYMEKYIVPNEGRLDWTLLGNNVMEITWDRVVDSSGAEEVPHDLVFYEAMVTTDYYYGFESS